MVRKMRKQFLRGLLSTVLVAGAGIAVAGPSRAAATSAIIDNGTIQLGVNDIGDLNAPGGTPSSGTGTTTVGVRYKPLNSDATAPGCACEGWGVADAGSGVSGWANQSAGTSNVTPLSFTSTASTAVSVVRI